MLHRQLDDALEHAHSRAALKPETLAVMHVSSCVGQGDRVLPDLAGGVREGVEQAWRKVALADGDSSSTFRQAQPDGVVPVDGAQQIVRQRPRVRWPVILRESREIEMFVCAFHQPE